MNDIYIKEGEKRELKISPFGIYINQAGYSPLSTKIAVMPFECSDFAVVNEKGEEVFNGKTDNFGYDKNSGDYIYKADFSSFSEKGSFRIKAGGKSSALFAVGEDAYEPVLKSVLKAFYYLRCGSGLSEKYAGVYKHAECHNSTAYLWGDESVTKDVSGGWHDAGDYGRYVTAGACALAHLLFGFELFGGLKNTVFDIPESGNGIPDILNECRVELEWMIKMQREDGGVYHKATTALHAPFVMPEDDKAKMYLFPVSSMAVADASAVFALASRTYEPYDKAFSDKLRECAERSYGWLKANPDFIGFRNPEGCNTGGYGEWEDRSNRFWASCELYALTGDEAYHKDLKALIKEDFSLSGLGYVDVGGFGSLSYILSTRNKDKAIEEKMTSAFMENADWLRKIADSCGYGVAMDEGHYHWGSNMTAMKNAMIFIIADRLSGENKNRPYVERLYDYLMGLNALGISYVTGQGEYRCNYPHLRPAHADGIEECIPGMVSGGPNRTPGDHDAKILIPEGTPPMKCYADEAGCYSLNEITIYWNSPTAFVLSYLNEK